jgi:hypothetical protein
VNEARHVRINLNRGRIEERAGMPCLVGFENYGGEIEFQFCFNVTPFTAADKNRENRVLYPGTQPIRFWLMVQNGLVFGFGT